MKIRSVGAELFHTDRHRAKLIVAFRPFANAPKKLSRQCLKDVVSGLLHYTLGHKDVCCIETSWVYVSC